jgi:dihydrodipicolinate synthase/N-acetylneuraminate lyase
LTVPYYRLLIAAEKDGITGEGNFIKAALEIVGLPAGPPRPPHQPMPEKYREQMREMLSAAGII